MSISIDSNAPYATALAAENVQEAVYMTADDPLLGQVIAVVYRANPLVHKLSVILVGNHGVSGYLDMTLDVSSRYFGACRGLADAHYASPVRKALAIAALRTYSTMDKPLRRFLLQRAFGEVYDEQTVLKYYDEAAAGALGSRFRLVHGKFPQDIGMRLIESGSLEPRFIKTGVIDVIYEDSDFTIDQNNDLVYMLGSQLEQLFDPLSEYSPEPTENLYVPPADSLATLEDDDAVVQEICEELYMLQSHIRSDLISFLQNFLIPLRVKVLSNEIPDMTIGKLNTMFPPTIDEIFRINNLFYEALQQALPYGSFEVLKACGTTVPYFYRACMRHEAATRNFSSNLASYDPALRHEVEAYSPQRIEQIMHSSLHLTKAKLIIERLVSTRVWTPEERPLVDEYYKVATGTIDSFGKEESVAGSYNKRTFTPTGKLLVEIAEGWPTELEYGWVNRRVVTIFDAVDIMEENNYRRQLHHIVIMFTDTVLILEPTEPIPMASISGLHIPSIGDILMHAMLNEKPLDIHVPRLKVVAWAPILEVTFASFGEKSLYITAQPGPFTVGSQNDDDKLIFSKCYKLVRSDHVADKFVELLAKAKVTTKTQPFHLFKVAKDDLVLYSTVHEIQGYNDEVNRYPIAVFLNTTVDKSTLKQHQLSGALSIRFSENLDMIDVHVLSVLNYDSFKSVSRAEFQDYVVNEITYLSTLALSSQNLSSLQSIVSTNVSTAEKLAAWAQTVPYKHKVGHRRGGNHHPNLSRVITTTGDTTGGDTTISDIRPTTVPTTRAISDSESGSVRHHASPSRPLRKMDNIEPVRRGSTVSDHGLDHAPSMRFTSNTAAANGVSTNKLSESFSYSTVESNIIYEFPARSKSKSRTGGRDDADDSWESVGEDSFSSAEEAEQRDVDAWYNQLDHRGASSLSSAISDVDLEESDFSSPDHSRNESVNSETIQVGGFLTRSASDLYNQHAGRAYPALSSHSRDPSRVSTVSSIGAVSNTDSWENDESTTGTEDFTYLGELVSDGESLSRSSSGRLYPGLRESSLVRLGSYVLSNDQSEPRLRYDPSHGDLPAVRELSNDYLGSQEPTPRLEDIALQLSDDEDVRETLSKWIADSGEPTPLINTEQPMRQQRSVDIGRNSEIPGSASLASFRRLVMSSSLNTLQVASITVQLDQIIASAPLNERPLLQKVKSTLTGLYNETHAFAKQYTPDQAASLNSLVKREEEMRAHVSWMVWTLLSMGRDSLVSPLLEIEWQRRSLLNESLADDLPLNIWRT